MKISDSLDRILDYEDGRLTFDEVIVLFAELIRTGLVWTLQGHYGQTAARLIEAGRISIAGEIL